MMLRSHYDAHARTMIILRHSRTLLLLVFLLLVVLRLLDLPLLCSLLPRGVCVVLGLLLAGPWSCSSSSRRLPRGAAAAFGDCRRGSCAIGLLRRRADHTFSFAARRSLLAAAPSPRVAAVALLAIARTLFVLAWTAPALHRHAIVHAWTKATIASVFWSRVCSRGDRGGGRLDQKFALLERRQNPVLPCKTMYGGANASLERTRKAPPDPNQNLALYMYLWICN